MMKEVDQFMIEPRHVAQHVVKYQWCIFDHGIVGDGLRDDSNKICTNAKLHKFKLGKEW